MKRIGFSVPMLIIALFTCLPFSAGAVAEERKEALFVNLTSDEVDRAAMAIKFATFVRKSRKIPVTIFLNVRAVHWANKNLPQHKHYSGETPAEMIGKFVASGGKVIICPNCMAKIGGMEKSDLIEGVEVGRPDLTLPALFGEGTRVLSY